MELKNLIAKQKKNTCIMATKDLAFLPIANVLISFFASRFFVLAYLFCLLSFLMIPQLTSQHLCNILGISKLEVMWMCCFQKNKKKGSSLAYKYN